MISHLPKFPSGYQPLRTLSERNGSWVFLALNPNGRHCCLKIQRLAHPAAVDSMAENRRLLSSLCAEGAWIRLICWGIERVESIVWEELELADDAISGKPFDAGTVEHYTPLTLAAYVREYGPIPTDLLISWAIGLTEALVRLHQAGLYHRDLKPANMLICRGRCVIADYGSVGAAGSSIEFPGTEGYVPPDGMGSPALDVFALGRSLYEAWTGLDRFQFPSLPPRVIEAADWQIHGWQLNQVLNGAAEKRPSHRIPTAENLLARLKEAKTPRKRISRRQVIGATAALVAGGMGGYFYKSLPPYKAVWRRLPPKRFGYEHFNASELTCDWRRKILYSIYSDARATVVQTVDLESFKHAEYLFPPTRNAIGGSAYIEDRGELWGVQHVTGKIVRFNTTEKTVSAFDEQDLDFFGFTGSTYLNTFNHRIGQFAGYGDFKCHNQRREFDVSTRQWILTGEESLLKPNPRYPEVQRLGLICRSKTVDRLILFGGKGNVSGRQSDRVAALKWYDGKYYPLNDLWELDLKTNEWEKILEPQVFNPTALKSVICHKPSDSILFLTGSESGRPQEARFIRTSGKVGETPQPLPNEGEIIEMFQFWCVLVNPETERLMVFADEGVFDVSIVPN